MFMEFEKGFLAACAETLKQLENVAPVEPPELASEVSLRTAVGTSLGRRTRAFLSALDYLPAQAGVGVTAAVRHDRMALLSLAGWFDRAFQLPMRHAPGAFFFGAQLSPLSFGIGTAAGPVVGVGGRGLTLKQAFESCAGEAAERLSIYEWPGDRPGSDIQGSGIQGERDRGERHREERGALRIRPAAESEPVLSGADLAWARRQMGLAPGSHGTGSPDWIASVSLMDGEPLLLPAALCLRPTPGQPGVPRPANTTGCAAGATIAAATLAALEEVVERDAVARWWQGDTPARPVAPDLLHRLGIDELGRRVRGDSPRRHWFLDVTGPLEVPAFVALSANPDGRAVVAGYGAGLDLRRALASALLELCQMELAQELALLKRHQRGEHALNAVDRRWIDQHELVALDSHAQFETAGPARSWADRPPTGSLVDLLSRLDGAGFGAYRVDLSRRPLGIKVVRVVVPGLETELPEWVAGRRRDAPSRGPSALSLI